MEQNDLQEDRAEMQGRAINSIITSSTISLFQNFFGWHCILDRVEIRFLRRYPMATHTDGVLRRAGQ